MEKLTPAIVERHVEAFIKMSEQLHGDYWKAEHYLSELPHKWELSFYISENNQPVAFMIVSDKGSSHHLHRIVVSAQYHGKGYGSQLLNRLISDAKAAKKDLVTLKVHPSNAEAIHIYEKKGFTRVGQDDTNFHYELKLK